MAGLSNTGIPGSPCRRRWQTATRCSDGLFYRPAYRRGRTIRADMAGGRFHKGRIEPTEVFIPCATSALTNSPRRQALNKQPVLQLPSRPWEAINTLVCIDISGTIAAADPSEGYDATSASS